MRLGCGRRREDGRGIASEGRCIGSGVFDRFLGGCWMLCEKLEAVLLRNRFRRESVALEFGEARLLFYEEKTRHFEEGFRYSK